MSTVMFHVGIDDTDSPKGGCTTYTMALVSDRLSNLGLEVLDYPVLVRLNPNVPWRTRGNAALALHISTSSEEVETVKATVLETVGETTDVSQPETDPAVAFLQGPISDSLRELYTRALSEIVPIEDALQSAKEAGVENHFLGASKRGIVGALAAVGADLKRNDCTFEMIAYRTQENCGLPRMIDPESVKIMDSRMGDRTFNNLDPETGRILVAPHGPDPVLFGVRGNDPADLKEAFEMIHSYEPIERVAMFRTNQGTDAHISPSRKVSTLRLNQSGNVTGKVETRPEVKRGGHVFFKMRDDTGSIDCAAYEPTGPFRKRVLDLLPGDAVTVYGSLVSGLNQRWTFNLEKLEISQLSESISQLAGACDQCGGSLESMGKGQGGRCRRCGKKVSGGLKILVRSQREIGVGTYAPPPRALRHLSKPLSRIANG